MIFNNVKIKKTKKIIMPILLYLAIYLLAWLIFDGVIATVSISVIMLIDGVAIYLKYGKKKTKKTYLNIKD